MVVVTQNKSRTAYLNPPGVPDNLALGSGPTVAAVSDLRGEGPKPLSSSRRYYRRVLLHSGSLVSHHWRLTRTTRCHQVGPLFAIPHVCIKVASCFNASRFSVFRLWVEVFVERADGNDTSERSLEV